MKTYLQTRTGEEVFDAFNDFFRPMFYEENAGFMRTDIREKEGCYELSVELPGFEKNEIKISLENGYLTVSAKRSEKESEEGKYLRKECHMSCQRSYYVGDDVEQENIKAKYEQGMLTLTVPKLSPKKLEARSISID